MLYTLESWIGSTTDAYTTVYLSQMRTFQRHITTCAFKIAGGVDLAPSAISSSRSTKQHPIPPEFTGKITKAFLDSLYAVLDGLVHLASDESSVTSVKQTVPQTISVTGANPLALLDLENAVRYICKDFLTPVHTPSTAHKGESHSHSHRRYDCYWWFPILGT